MAAVRAKPGLLAEPDPLQRLQGAGQGVPVGLLTPVTSRASSDGSKGTRGGSSLCPPSSEGAAADLPLPEPIWVMSSPSWTPTSHSVPWQMWDVPLFLSLAPVPQCLAVTPRHHSLARRHHLFLVPLCSRMSPGCLERRTRACTQLGCVSVSWGIKQRDVSPWLGMLRLSLAGLAVPSLSPVALRSRCCAGSKTCP